MGDQKNDEIKAGADVNPSARAGGRAAFVRRCTERHGRGRHCLTVDWKKTRARYCLIGGRVITYPAIPFSHNAAAVATPVLGRVGTSSLPDRTR